MTILITIISIIAVIFFFGLTIFIHEFGHFIAGRLLGLKAPIFSIGFGPTLLKKKIGDTEFRISLIPLGGYVSLPELDPTGMELIQGDADQKTEELKPAIWWKRIIVAFAGPLGNIILAVVLALIISACPRYSNIPEQVRIASSGYVVGYVDEESPAAEAGIRVGDIIHEVNGRKVVDYNDFVQEVHLGSSDGYATVCLSNLYDSVEACLRVPVEMPEGQKYYSIKGIKQATNLVIGSVVTNSPAAIAGFKEKDYLVKCNGVRLLSGEQLTDFINKSDGAIDFTIFRDGQFVDLKATPEFDEKEQRKIIGISYGYAVDFVRPWDRHRNPVDQLKGDSGSIFRILDSLFTPKTKGESSRTASALGGPISIFTVMWFNFASGFVSFLAFIRFLNINLAILNLLPIPILDGGHIIFALWRGIFRRELPAKVITVVCNLFAALLICFFIYVSCNDVSNLTRIFGGKSNEEKVEEKPVAEEAVVEETENNAQPSDSNDENLGEEVATEKDVEKEEKEEAISEQAITE